MSNQQSINFVSAGKNWSLQTTKSDNDFIYLSLKQNHFNVPIDEHITLETDYYIKIPIKVWRQIVSDWLKSDWSKDFDRDNKQKTFNFDFLDKLDSKK